jgi:hypothetical protein
VPCRLPAVKALPALLAELAGGHLVGQRPRQHRVGPGQRLARRHGDVEAHGVDQLDRPHRHAEGGERRVDGLGRDALVHAAQRLVHVGPEHRIDQKARRVPHRQRQLVELAHEGRGAPEGLVAGGRGAHHLDQRHHRHRVEEMHAHQPGRVGSAAAMSAMRRLEVLEAISASGRAPLDVGEQRALGLQVLEDRLDHHVGLGHAVAGRVGDQAVEGEAHLPRLAAQLALEALGGPGDGRRDALDALVLQGHDHAAQGAFGGDVAAHHAGAHHMHPLRRKVGVLAEGLQALLQVEHPHQVLGGGRAEDRLQRRRRSAGTASALPPWRAQMSMIAKGAG